MFNFRRELSPEYIENINKITVYAVAEAIALYLVIAQIFLWTGGFLYGLASMQVSFLFSIDAFWKFSAIGVSLLFMLYLVFAGPVMIMVPIFEWEELR